MILASTTAGGVAVAVFAVAFTALLYLPGILDMRADARARRQLTDRLAARKLSDAGRATSDSRERSSQGARPAATKAGNND